MSRVRRIQEVFDESGGGQQMMAGGGSGGSEERMLTPGPEDSGLEGVPLVELPQGGSVEEEEVVLKLDEETPGVLAELEPEGSSGGGMMSMSSSTVWTDREYIWGPDYVDECIAQIDGDDYVMYVLQDANYNVVALLDEDGRALAQYTYTPYGAIHISESFEAHPFNRLGHQGLFFERYNATINDPILVVNSQGLYHARNRWYHPLLGRWTSRDPNASAAPLLETQAINGTALDVFTGGLDIHAQYSEGMNLYHLAQSEPINNRDPLGLFTDYDPFAEVDDFTLGYSFDLMGVGAQLDSARGNIFGGAVLSAMYASAGFLWDEFVWELGEDALFGLIAGGFGASACFVEDTPVRCAHGSVPIAEVGVGECVASSPDGHLTVEPSPSGVAGGPDTPSSPVYWALTFILTDHSGARCTASLLRSNDWFSESELRVGSECFLATSEPPGVLSARLVDVQLVLSVSACPPGHQLVTGAFTREPAQLQEITIAGLSGPLRTTPTHKFYSLDRCEWVPAKSLHTGEHVAAAGSLAIVTDSRSIAAVDRVYNVEVESWHTYFVSEADIWVHNGCYRHIPDPPGVAAGRRFTDVQRSNILGANYARNGGRLRSDLSGRFLTARSGTPYSAQIDHIVPRSRGGTNSYGNAQVLSALENQRKGAIGP